MATRFGMTCWARAALLVALARAPALAAQAPLLSATPECDTAAAAKAFAAKQFSQSAASLQTMIAEHPRCAAAHYLLAESLLRLGSAKESLAEYTIAARLGTPASADLRNVALDYVLLEDNSDARRWAVRARDLAPNNAENWYVLGRIDYSSGNFPDAVAAFEQTLRLDPASIKAENNLGLAYEGLEQDQAALAAYRKAIELGDQASTPSEQPLINLAILLMHQADAPGALPLLLRAVKIAPNDVRAHEQLGKLYMRKRDWPEAQGELEQAVALSPSDSRLHFFLGQVYRQEGQEEKAAAEFARTAELGGTHSTPNYLPKTKP